MITIIYDTGEFIDTLVSVCTQAICY